MRPANFCDPEFVGRELSVVDSLVWTGNREVPKSERISNISSFYTSLFLSPRAKQLFEDRGIEGVQYIPLKLFDHAAANDVDYEEWWCAHVHNWKAPFDLEKSAFDYYDWPEEISSLHRVESTFGSRPITRIRRLVENPLETTDDVFLAKVPHNRICNRVYFSRDFANYLRDGFDPGSIDKLYLDEDAFKPSGFL